MNFSPDLMPAGGEPEPSRDPVRCLWQGDLLRLGLFVAPPSHPLFRNSGPIRGSNIVFPRTALRISWGGGRDRWSDRGNLNFYNDGDEFERKAVGSEGDRCIWIEPRPVLLTQLADRLPYAGREVERRPFRYRQGPASPALSHSMLKLVGYLGIGNHTTDPWAVDRLVVEEEALAVVHGVLGAQGGRRSVRPGPDDPSKRWVESARELLAESYAESMGLDGMARRIGCSPYYLARSFRAATGTTLHRYRLHLRLDAAVERLLWGESDISRLAFGLGFSSHSHFTSTFRRHLGVTPSSVRRRGFRVSPNWGSGFSCLNAGSP